METVLEDHPHVITPRGVQVRPCAPHEVLARLGDKWTILVILRLALAPEHRLRFSEIKYGVAGISQRMLTLTLRELERNGLAVRHYFAEVPPRVEYELSSLGVTMLGPLETFTNWIGQRWPDIKTARQRYDDRLAVDAERD